MDPGVAGSNPVFHPFFERELFEALRTAEVTAGDNFMRRVWFE